MERIAIFLIRVIKYKVIKIISPSLGVEKSKELFIKSYRWHWKQTANF